LAVNEAFARLNEGIGEAWGRTRLVFTSDHGEEFWDHGAFEHGHSLYSELTRVPLILMGEGIPQGRSSTMVAHQDLYTTLASWGGAAHSAGYGGLDLLSLGASDVPGRSIVSESTLYGGAKMSLVKKTHRLVLDQAMNTINLMCMDRETLIEDECAERDADWEALQESMYQELFALRGHLNPVVHTTELRKTLDRNTADRLEALGYLE